MKILVLGKNGQVARELNNFSNIISLGSEKINFLDLQNCQKEILKTDPDIIINTAAYTDVEEAEIKKEKAMILNCDAPGLIAKIAEDKKIPFIHLSTDYVFGDNGEIPLKETDNTKPLGVYGLSKLLGEEKIQHTNAQYLILRTSWIFSKYKNNFLDTMIDLSKKRTTIKIVADQVGSPTEASDIAKICIFLSNILVKNKGIKGIYHYSGFPYVSWADFARKIFDITNSKIIVENISTSEYSSRVKRPLNSRLDCNRIKKEFNVDQPLWEKSLEKVLRELKLNDNKT
tara:strand:+ start:130 stop:990 length:861 start_codon:yes stop_codon:yes gene_type:complete